MHRHSLYTGCLLSLAIAGSAFAQTAPKAAPKPAPAKPVAAQPAPVKKEPPPVLPSLSADQIVDRNIAARGGLTAWRAVNTLSLAGELDAGGKPSHSLPFVLRQKRPRKTRLEIVFKDQTSVQVYDGVQGWKVRPFLNRNDVESYTPAELKSASSEQDLDGPLIDHAAKGTKIGVAGTDVVDGHPAYVLSLTLRNGDKRNLWIDAGTFLEVKMDGEPRKLDGRLHKVAVYFRNYKTENGLAIPRLQETAVEGVKDPYKMTITKVTVNESMSDALFQKPQPAPLLPPSPPAPIKIPAAAPAAAAPAAATTPGQKSH